MHDTDEQMTIFIDGLDPSIRTLVARHREQRPRHELSYQELAQFARDGGDAYRARTEAQTTRTARVPRANGISRTQPNLLLSQATSSLVGSHVDGELMLVGDGPELESDRTSELPSTEPPASDLVPTMPAHPQGDPHSADAEVDATLYAAGPGRRVVRHLALPYQTPAANRGRPGWIDNRNQYQPQQPTRDLSIICHTCYAGGHYASECKLPFNSFQMIVNNYNALSDAQKATVPQRSYQQASALMRLEKDDEGASKN